jgi:outer membrane protein TolC
VLSAYYDYELNAELIRLEKSDQQLLKTTATVTEAQNRAGSSGQQHVLRAENQADLSANDIASMESQLVSQRAAINAILSRPADAELPVPNELTPPRSLTYSDTELIELVAKRNPELTALADEIRGRGDGIRLANLQYVPDFNLSAGTDLMGVTQSLLGQATVPFLRYEAIDAAIAQAEANLHASEAMRRQTANDLTAQVVTDIAVIHDADRQIELLEQSVLPNANQITNVGRAAYESGHATLLDLLDDQRSLNAIARLIANMRIIREKHLVDLETIAASNLSIAHG